MAINKVEFGDQTLMDLTGDTVTPEDVLGGKTFHTKSGDASVGTAGPYAGSATNGGPATTAKKLFGQDTRSVNSPPSFYLASGQNSTLVTEFKNRAVIDAPGSSNFGTLITITPWMDNTGGLPVQIYVDNTGQRAIRFAQTEETWGSWGTLALTSNIPSVGNGTIKLQRNGVDVLSFTTNQSGNTTGNLIVPTKVSELTNDSGYLTAVYTSSVNAVVGDTTCTISDSSITTTSLIEPFSSNSTGDTIAIKNIAVTAGQAVLTFKALTVDTSFRLRITNV